MRNQPTDFQPNHRLHGVVATVAVHAALVLCWLLTRQPGADTDRTPRKAIAWVNVRPDTAVTPAKPPEARVEPVMRRQPVAPRATHAMVATPVLPAPVRAPAPAETPSETPAEAPAAQAQAQAPAMKSAYDIMQQARRDIGSIDKGIKKEFPEQHIKKPLDTPQARLEKGIELANELAPPRWYEAAKVKELIDPGGYGRRRYRVITAHGTFCMTYESAHSPDGRDPMTRNTAPKMTNCPPHEEPAKAQQW